MMFAHFRILINSPIKSMDITRGNLERITLMTIRLNGKQPRFIQKPQNLGKNNTLSFSRNL